MQPSSSARPPEAIFIGGSVGAIDALQVLLPALPRDLRWPVIVLVHLPPDRPSLLPAIFARVCPLPVREAQDKEPITAGTVYFAPPDYHLLVSPGGRFSLSVDPPVFGSRPSIDVLFESAAWAFGGGALAVALTGASRDGASGLAAVGRAQGRTWVLSPGSPGGEELPRAALLAWPQARPLGLSAMAAALGRVAAEPADERGPAP